MWATTRSWILPPSHNRCLQVCDGSGGACSHALRGGEWMDPPAMYIPPQGTPLTVIRSWLMTMIIVGPHHIRTYTGTCSWFNTMMGRSSASAAADTRTAPHSSAHTHTSTHPHLLVVQHHDLLGREEAQPVLQLVRVSPPTPPPPTPHHTCSWFNTMICSGGKKRSQCCSWYAYRPRRTIPFLEYGLPMQSLGRPRCTACRPPGGTRAVSVNALRYIPHVKRQRKH